MNFRKGMGREDPEINLIAFIDVLLVILIFLMVTTTYSKYSELHITLPTANADKSPDRPTEINIAVDASGNYAINNQKVAANTAAELAEYLSKEAAGSGRENESSKEPTVIISADASAVHQKVINVLEAARIVGLVKVTFAAQTGSK